VVDGRGWRELIAMAAEGVYDLSGLWHDDGRVRMALSAREGRDRVIASIALENGAYPSVGAVHAPAVRLERAMRDLHGIKPVGLEDRRPWLDHGKWPGSAVTYAATPEPKWVVAIGDCAANCGVFAGSPVCVGPVSAVIPVDLHVPGCPPRPDDILQGLLALLEASDGRLALRRQVS
jgi:hypothetical protein